MGVIGLSLSCSLRQRACICLFHLPFVLIPATSHSFFSIPLLFSVFIHSRSLFSFSLSATIHVDIPSFPRLIVLPCSPSLLLCTCSLSYPPVFSAHILNFPGRQIVAFAPCYICIVIIPLSKTKQSAVQVERLSRFLEKIWISKNPTK